jgi:hypothetical protein
MNKTKSNLLSADFFKEFNFKTSSLYSFLILTISLSLKFFNFSFNLVLSVIKISFEFNFSLIISSNFGSVLVSILLQFFNVSSKKKPFVS